jgi:nucleotide-binding universal stress UspA family protein
MVPKELKPGPATGQWRESKLAARYGDRLFADLLVPVSGEPAGWLALEQALMVARQERAELHGLHVVATEVQRESEEARAVQAEFTRRCEAAGVSGTLAVEAGEVATTICRLAPLTDLVVLNLSYPPAPQALARLGSGFRTILHRCPRPVLAVPRTVTSFGRVLLAYDGSPKAHEALFVAAYLAETWGAQLSVVTVKEDSVTSETLAPAREYLDLHEVKAAFIEREREPVSVAILLTAEEQQSDLIVIGGYGSGPVLDVVLGSAVDQVLRESRRPMLICR